jgi:hypothetical protein
MSRKSGIATSTKLVLVFQAMSPTRSHETLGHAVGPEHGQRREPPPVRRLGDAEQEDGGGVDGHGAEADGQASLGQEQRGAQEAHRARVGQERLDGELPAVVGHHRREEGHGGHGRIVETRAQPGRQPRQQDVDAHVRVGGEREGQRPDAPDGQGVPAELVGGPRRHPREAAPEDVQRDVERRREERGAAGVRHAGRQAVQGTEDPAEHARRRGGGGAVVALGERHPARNPVHRLLRGASGRCGARCPG